MSEALYRKYRSKKLSEIVGQHHVTDILTRALQNDKVSHAYLLTGPRGVGKTSIARILAHEINGLEYDGSEHLDIIEIDAASNNGVEDVRELREKIRLAPVSAPKKIYIIDEVHMLSKPAFNALLKTLEEPPSHAVFILATTDVDKIPATILSRTQRFSLRLVPQADITNHLKMIASSESIAIDDDALELVAQHGGGTFRDSISLLDQLQHLTNGDVITRQMIETMLGLAPRDLIEKLLNAAKHNDVAQINQLIAEAESHGATAALLADQLVLAVRALVATDPELLTLLDQLLEVAKSSRPDVKLLVTLAQFAQKPKSVPLVVEKTAPDLVVLEQAAASDHPQKTLQKSLKKPTADTPPVAHAAKKPSQKSSTEPVTETKSSPAKQPTPAASKAASDFDWQAIVTASREKFVAIFSVISKCEADFDGSTLTIFARNKFYKTKLDDPKHRVNLAKVLAENGFEAVEIVTLPSTRPPKNADAAMIAAMMGGGEEVSLD